ncbi:MAG: murein transglycosylase A [Desulfuromonas sp.]|nr:murein transglycosylase A [Desulfuromonas sp.]
MANKVKHRVSLTIRLVVLLALLGGCVPSVPVVPPTPPEPPQVVHPALQQAHWDDLPNWQEDNHLQALVVFRTSCKSLKNRPAWRQVCARALAVDDDAVAAQEFFRTNFTPWQLVNEDGSVSGKITGYYAPDLNGSRESSSRYPYPLYKKPADLLVIDLTDQYPELGSYHLRGRLSGQRVVPYFDRAQIDGATQPLYGNELFWVDDPVRLFFLQIQGSGRINLDDGTQVMVRYAEHNGYPFRSIGKLLRERGYMTTEQMSMPNIAAWGRSHPREVQQLLNENPRYVFFSPLAEGIVTPPGAMNLPLTAQRSIAVDTNFIPLGAPVFLATTWPSSDRALQRLMVAQDTGAAIKGRVRADFFWGVGDIAASYALKTKQAGNMWLLLPKDMDPQL